MGSWKTKSLLKEAKSDCELQFGHDGGLVENAGVSEDGLQGQGWLQFGHDGGLVENLIIRDFLAEEAPPLQFGHDGGLVENEHRDHPA